MASIPKPEQPPFEILRALDDAGLTKAQFRIMAHIWRRGECFERVREMARRCRMNHQWVRIVLRQLIVKQMLTRTVRPGHTSVVQLTDLGSWLFESADDRAIAEKRSQSAGELDLDVQAEFFNRLGVRLNKVEAAWFAGCARSDADKFERVMAEVVDRNKRKDLAPLKSVCSFWTDTWKKFKA